MLFVKTEDLKQGMRLAKPIYNKKGVLLYGRDTKLTEQGIASVKNFELIGVYILEPAEPLPPMTDEDIEFERFQTMSVFSIKDEMRLLKARQEPKNISRLADLIIKNYGRQRGKINFAQNLRSPSDYVYKHSLNVAILSAIISNKLACSLENQRDAVISALYYDIGRLLIDDKLACKDEPTEEEMRTILKGIKDGYTLLDYTDVTTSIRRIVTQAHREIYRPSESSKQTRDRELVEGTKILMVADMYDRLTAMKYDEVPMSEIAVVRRLQNSDLYDKRVVDALLEGINIVVPGVCVELTSGEKGLVIKENKKNILQPMVLGFTSNSIYNLEYMSDTLQIKDIMKSMDNRIIIDKSLINEYQ